MTCPECHGDTIERIGGEWCPRCRRFVVEVGTHPHEDFNQIVRVLKAPH